MLRESGVDLAVLDATGAVLHRLRDVGPIVSASPAPDGDALCLVSARGGGRVLEAYRLGDEKRLWQRSLQTDGATVVASATTCLAVTQNTQLSWFDLRTGAKVRPSAPGAFQLYAIDHVESSPDRRWFFAIGDQGNQWKVFDASLAPLAAFESECAGFLADGTPVRGADGPIYLLARTDRKAWERAPRPRPGGCTHREFHPREPDDRFARQWLHLDQRWNWWVDSRGWQALVIARVSRTRATPMLSTTSEALANRCRYLSSPVWTTGEPLCTPSRDARCVALGFAHSRCRARE
jgi:hypothetical protein